MKILIVGLGSIGRRHLKNIKKLQPRSEVAVLRRFSKDGLPEDLKNLVGYVFMKPADALKWKPDVVFVTNPAPFHVSAAMRFAKRGSHLFIEKPLSISLKDIGPLLNLCHKRELVVMVGYCLRFLKPLQVIKDAIEKNRIGRVLCVRASVGRHLPDWRPGDYRKHVSARKELGGGVVFELSHELDYLRWLIGEIRDVSVTLGTVSDLDINTEDVAEINLRFKSGAIGNIHLDMVDMAVNRWCRVIGTLGTLIWDSAGGHSVFLYSHTQRKAACLWKSNSHDYNQMYIDELKHFFSCIRRKSKPLIDGETGRRIV